MYNYNIEIYADGADIDSIFELNKDPMIRGFTTNPTLMKASGITDYEGFAKKILGEIKDKPVSFEVFADNQAEMFDQALKISAWGDNVYVKIPIMNTKEVSNTDLMHILSRTGVKVNATAITNSGQITNTIKALDYSPAIISIFAGRIADTGSNPCLFVNYAARNKLPCQKILWASTREPYNYIMARNAGADIITITDSILKKMKSLWNKALYDVSLDTVKMFYKDAQDSGFSL